MQYPKCADRSVSSGVTGVTGERDPRAADHERACVQGPPERASRCFDSQGLNAASTHGTVLGEDTQNEALRPRPGWLGGEICHQTRTVRTRTEPGVPWPTA